MIELKNSKMTYLGKASGRDKYSLDAFIGAVQMREPEGQWQDIKPRLVREADGWRIDGAPYYAEIKDDGTRLFCPDRNEHGKYLRLPSPVYFSSLDKSIVSSPVKIDGQLLPNRVSIPTDWGEYRIIFSNTGMHFEVLFIKTPPSSVFGKDSPRIIIDTETSGYDIGQLLSGVSGTGIPRPRLLPANPEAIIDESQERWLDWSYKNGQLELGFDFGDLQFPILLKNTTVDVEVGAGNDDCSTYSTVIVLSDVKLYLDRSWGTVRTYTRFVDITIPNSATIDHAYMDYHAYSNYTGSSDLRIYGIDEDDTATFSTQADADGRPVTTAYKDWTAGNWSNGVWYGYTNDPQDIKDIIQEIVNRGGWASGNALATKIYNTSTGITRDCESYENTIPPKLHIEYTAGGATEKTSAETGSGADVSSLLSAMAKVDTGTGSEQGLLSLLISSADAGTGAEAAEILLAGITKGDSGSGTEYILDRALRLPDSGSGADVFSDLLAAILKSETGVGIDQGTLSSIIARLSADAGSGAEIAELVAGLGVNETGLGIDAGVIVGLKQLFSGDEGACGDVLKALISTSGKGSDMKLPGRQGRVGMPSRGVSL